MKIELKNFHINERMSEETIMFQADLFINGKKAGYAENLGRGGPTDYHAYDAAGRQLIEEAEKYCASLPDLKRTHQNGGKTEEYTVKMTLEEFIDDLLLKKLKEMDDKELEKKMANSLLWGAPDAPGYTQLRFNKPIATILATPKHREQFKDVLKRKVIPNLKEGDKILNTNIHPDELVSLGIPKVHTIEQAVTVKRHTGGPRPKIPDDQKKKRGKRP